MFHTSTISPLTQLEFCLSTKSYGSNKFNLGDLGWTWFQGQKYIPFLSRNDLFEFRTTASYFLCNYTLLQKSSYEHMGFPGTLDAGSRSQG